MKLKKRSINKAMGRIGVILILLLLTSCQRDWFNTSGGERVKVTLGITLPAPVNAVPDTRGNTAAPASFYNLWAFQFGADGNIVGTPQQLSDSQTPIGEGKNLTLSLTVGQNQTIYLFSAGKKLTPNLVDIKTLTELEAYKLDYTTSESGGYTSAITNPEDIPCAGCVKGANVISLGQGAGMLEYDSPAGFSGSISLKQLVAKVTLRYKYTPETHTLQGVRLQNVNRHVSISPYTPANGTEVCLFNLQHGAPDAQGFYTASWYVAQNLQGTNTAVTSEMDRYYKEGVNLAPQYGLCLEVLGRNKTKPSEYSVHRIYVGNNNTTNFDVEAGHHYTLTTDFTSAWVDGNTDPRLSVTEFTSAKISFYTSACIQSELCSSSTGEKYDLDAHYDFRPISVEVFGCSVELGIYTDAVCTQLAQMSDKARNWLQLSVEPNYTLAVNNRTSPLTNRLKVDARIHSKLKFYLYNDEFVDVKPDNSTLKRSLYVKISTVELDVSNPKTTTDIFRIDQRPIMVCGRYGGMQNQTNGVYDCWLGIDQIEEYQNKYSDETVSTISNLPYGYKYSTEYALPDGWMNGMGGTIKLAENPNNFKEPSLTTNTGTGTPTVALPIKIGGKIDLYQYTYYTAYVSRFCYDRNRDLDGSGALESWNSRGENEIKWYLPGGNQGVAIWMEDKQSIEYLSCAFPEPSHMSKNSGIIFQNTTTSFYNARCVRDLSAGTSPAPILTMASVTNTDINQGGSSRYPVISVPHGVNRLTEKDFYVNISLYDDNGTEIIESGNKVTVRRIKRHEVSTKTNNFSSKFAISPVLEPLTWMEAGGWGSNAFDDMLNTNMAVAKGCPVYKGRDGKDTPGTWRLPTHRELNLLSIMVNVLSTVDGGFFDGGKAQIWSATEQAGGLGMITSCMKSNVFMYNSNKKNLMKYRCVRDLP